jgi:nucleotide-binding universal stress UspA family protein
MHDDHADVTIVVGLDGSLSSKRAFAFALGTAQRSGGRVVAAYVARLTSPAVSIGMAIGAANGVLPSVDSAAKPIVDEIVGASRARTSRFFGSVGRNLVRNASWPVVVVP